MAKTSIHPTLGAGLVPPAQSPRLLSALGVASGALWTVAVTLVGTQTVSDPVGSGYDAANRVLTLPLLLLVGYAVVHRRTVPLGIKRKGSLALVVGSVLLLAGNVLEFWLVLFSSRHTEKTAARLGEAQAFWGSSAGWILFALGMIVTIAAAVMLGRAIGGRRGWTLVVLAVVGLISTAMWAVSPLLAAATGLAFAGWLIGLTQALHLTER